MTSVTIYTDGGCIGNPGPGGWAAVCINGNKVHELTGRFRQTTNNRMELLAAIKGLESIEYPANVIIVTDSTYVRNGIISWAERWRRNGWLTANRRPVKNRDLWERLLNAVDRHGDGGRVTWEWTKGHAGQETNERADYLANLEARSVTDSDPLDTRDAPNASGIEQRSLFSE